MVGMKSVAQYKDECLVASRKTNFVTPAIKGRVATFIICQLYIGLKVFSGPLSYYRGPENT